MIDESFIKSNFLGRDGFIWWIGQVADPSVWRNEKVNINNEEGAWSYRCKVRIIGYHSFDRNELDDKDLPWAHILTSAADGAPGQGGFGKTPLLIGGESVVGFFLDGEEAQQPVVMGTFHRSPIVENIDNPNPFEPFTGFKGPFASGNSPQATRERATADGTTKEVPEKLGEGSQFTMFQNANFGIDAEGTLDLDAGFAPITSDGSDLAGSAWNLAANVKFRDRLFYGDRAEALFLNEFKKTGKVTGDNGCGDNILAQIKNALETFIQTVNGLQQTALGFIDPVRNIIVDIQSTVSSVARLIATLMKFTINAMRDNIFKLIGKLFKLLGITIPSPLQLPISEATKNILNIIFCIFEKLFGPLMDFIMGLLNGLLGKTPNIPRCAAEEITGSLINKIADMIQDALAAVMSGLDWLASGISDIFGTLSGALNIISQILSFLECDSLSCKSTKEWDPFDGLNFPNIDSWANVVSNMDILSGLGGANEALGYLSVFGSSDTPFSDCRKIAVNPQNQGDISPVPIGTRFYKCIPPEVKIYGDGTGGRAKAVVSEIDGSIVTFVLCDAGSGYTNPPQIKVVDNTNYGRGAQAKTTISNGRIESIYIVNPGSGYCQTNLSEETSPGIGTGGVGVGSTTPPCIDVGQRRLSNGVSGINTNLVIQNPGVGYTSGDTIQVGNCIYTPIVTPNGNIISFKSADCPQEFKTRPEVNINTTTGQGAVIYPVLQFKPQFIEDNPDLFNNANIAGITSVINVVDCV